MLMSDLFGGVRRRFRLGRPKDEKMSKQLLGPRGLGQSQSGHRDLAAFLFLYFLKTFFT
jgi:hypothetical protein